MFGLKEVCKFEQLILQLPIEVVGQPSLATANLWVSVGRKGSSGVAAWYIEGSRILGLVLQSLAHAPSKQG